jgi:hypothetical protein
MFSTVPSTMIRMELVIFSFFVHALRPSPSLVQKDQLLIFLLYGNNLAPRPSEATSDHPNTL